MTTIVSRPGSSPAARRRLAESGGWEEAWWFGPDGQRLFGFLHLPEGRPRAGIVVCSPLHAEFLRNYRREVLVARALAARGFAVQRFHYRGTGSSDGQASEATYETMRQDALLAAGHVLERSGATRLGFLGTRWGALVAADAAAGFPGAPLALWEPVVDPQRWFRDVFRARLIAEMKAGHASGVGASTPSSGDAFADSESLEVVGFEVHRPLFDSSRGVDFPELGDGHRSVLVVPLVRSGGPGPELAGMIGRWREAGLSVEVAAIPEEEVWWFDNDRAFEPEEQRSLTSGMLTLTSSFFDRSLAEGPS